MEAIRSWLNGRRDYATGVQLYRQYGTSEALKKMFREEPSEFKARKLATALEALLTATAPTPEKKAQAEAAVVEQVAQRGKSEYAFREGMDEVETALWNSAREKLKQLDYLCSIQYELGKQGQHDNEKLRESGEVAFRTLDLDEEIGAIYQKLAYYREHKKLPEEKKLMPLVSDPIKMPVALKNAERYCREYRSQLEREPGNARAAQHLVKWEWAVKEYKRLLKLDL